MTPEYKRVWYYLREIDRVILNFDVTCEGIDPYTVVEAFTFDGWLDGGNLYVSMKPMLGLEIVTDTLDFIKAMWQERELREWWVNEYCEEI